MNLIDLFVKKKSLKIFLLGVATGYIAANGLSNVVEYVKGLFDGIFTM